MSQPYESVSDTYAVFVSAIKLSCPENHPENGEHLTNARRQVLTNMREYNSTNYDFETVFSILNSTFFSEVSFVITDEDGEPSPFSLPMTAAAGQYDPSTPLPEDDGDEEAYSSGQESCSERSFDVYLHGNSAMLLRKMAKSNGSVKVVVPSTKVDGVILHFAPNGHSLNYRSCVIHGDAQMVESADEKRYAMHRLTNHMSRRRWSAVNEAAPKAMESIQVIKVVIRSASAKIRATNINGLEKAGLGERGDIWTGAIPVFEVLGEPVESGYRPGLPIRIQIMDWIQRRNDKERSYSERVAQVPPKEAEKIHNEYGAAAQA